MCNPCVGGGGVVEFMPIHNMWKIVPETSNLC